MPGKDDPEWMLFVLYFVPCDLMRQHTERVRAAIEKTGDESIAQEYISWTVRWFASLYVVVEGWNELKLADPLIDASKELHLDSLRLLRNATFHYQKTDHKFQQWIDIDKFNWATDLHRQFMRYFSSKRMG